jgi:enoyl-CoA hydratase/carnithine racemase
MFLANSIQPAGGHLRMLEDIGGRSLAIRLAVFDQPLAAEAILAAGLATSVHEPHEVEAEAIHFASRAAGQPVLARAIKRSAVGVSRLTVEESADYEGAAQAATLRER